MSLILYSLDLSSACRAVLLTAEALGLKLQIKNVNLFNSEQLTPEFLKMNPQHTVPTLNDNGYIIWDSHAICVYLVSKYGKNDSLYPKDLQKRALIDQRLYFDSGIIFPRMGHVFVPILYHGIKEISKESQEAMYEAYSFIESFLNGKSYIAGDNLTIADLSIIASLSTIIPLVPCKLDQYPNINRWLNTMKKLPYYEKANGKSAEIVAKKALDIINN